MSPVLALGRLLHEDVVAVEDAVLDHRLADDPEAKHLAVAADQDAIDADRIGRVLDREDRLTRGDPAEDRDLGHVIVRR